MPDTTECTALTPENYAYWEACDTLVSPPWNPRDMPDDEFANLKASLRDDGFMQPIIVNTVNKNVLGGNQRLDAAKAIGLTQVPVVWITVTSLAREKAIAIKLNRISGRFNIDKLSACLRDIAADDPSQLAGTGLDETELRDLIPDVDINACLADVEDQGAANPGGSSDRDRDDDDVQREVTGGTQTPATPREPPQPERNAERVSLAFYTMRWGDFQERMAPATYERFAAAADNYAMTHPQGTVEAFLDALLTCFHDA